MMTLANCIGRSLVVSIGLYLKQKMTRVLAALFHVERFVDASMTAANADFLRVEYLSDMAHVTDDFCTTCIALDEIDALLSGLNLLSGSTHHLVYRYDGVDMCPSVSSWLSALRSGDLVARQSALIQMFECNCCRHFPELGFDICRSEPPDLAMLGALRNLGI